YWDGVLNLYKTQSLTLVYTVEKDGRLLELSEYHSLFFLLFIADFVGASEDPSVPLRPEGCSSRVKERVQTIFSDNTSGVVIGLDLGVNSLEGEINSSSSLFRLKINSISNLKHLNVLRLHDYNFSGLIPSSLGNLSRLANIHLSGNTSGGETPTPSFGRLNQLTSLDVDSNKLSGNFPIALLNLTKLTYLSLSYNQFTGILPPNISSLSSLENFEARQNSFFGTIPSTLFFTIPSLGTIDLADQLRSPTRYIFKNATSLRSLNLGHNHFVGKLPRSLISCSALESTIIPDRTCLQVLILRANEFHGPQLGTLKELTLLNLSNTLSSGTVPTELLHLTKLVSLDLSSNSLSAQKSFLNNLSQNLTNLEELNLGLVDISSEIPPNISKLSSLKSLSLDECNLFVFFMIPTIQSINLQGNQDMVGSLPENNSLVFLDLSWISLGNLPVSINNLKHLTTLKLGFCNLHGQISSSLGNLTNLSTLDLSSNFFNGHIPSSFGNLLHLTSLVISSNRLSGQIPPSFANLNQLTTLSLVSNKLSGNFPLPCITQSHKVVRVITGTLPPNISALCNLETFEASENIFTGTLPSTLFNTPSLTYIDLKDNQLNAILEFGNISSPSKLERLSLGNNHFKGSLPISILSLVNLYSLDLSYYNTGMSVDFGFFLSQLKGVIDMDISYKNTTNIVDLSTIFLHLKSLSSLQLSGVHVSTAKMGLVSNLPTNLGTLHLLLEVGEYHSPYPQRLEGPPPKVSWKQLSCIFGPFSYILFGNQPQASECFETPRLQFQWLDSFFTWKPFSFNKISTSLATLLVPTRYIFKNATSLRSLNLGHNHFVGKLPRSLISCSSLEVLNVEHNRFNDTFPFWLQSLKNLQVLILRSNEFHEPMSFLLRSICFVFVLNILNTFASPTRHLCRPDEKNALLEFVNEFEIRNLDDAVFSSFSYPKTNSWSNKSDCCSWDGITCHAKSGEVVELDLSSSCFHGKLSSKSSLFKLQRLRVLNLAYNDLVSSEIPSQLGTLKELTLLNLSNTLSSGPIPTELLHLTKLVSLDLSSNSLSAQKSFLNNLSQNLTNLEELNLGLVDISSEIPPNISKLSSLKSLSLDECNLFGNLPVSINNLKHLTTLKLGFCNLHGQISSSLGNLTNLSTLDLSSNFFNGHIPSSFGNLLHLTSLVLSSNRLSGQIPPSFANLNQLTTLSLVSNKLSGNFPLPLLNLTKLSELSLVNNHFTGTLPPNISALCNLETFEASENIFTGTLPSTLFNTPSLTYIDLKDNQLNAILEFGNISSPSKLERLSLGNNHFKGSLPISISSLVNLYSLDLSYYNTGMSVDFGFLSQLKGLIDLDISYINTTNIVDLSTIFLHLKSLSSLQLSGVHVSTAKMGCGITEFPKFLKKLQKMSQLDLSDNKIKDLSSNAFQGPLFDPPVSTEALVVSNNNFTGKIPESICEQRYLQTLDLSNNSFTGSIPQCLKNLNSYLSFLILHHNQLNGSIPEIFNNATDLVSIDVSQNRLVGKLPRSLKSCTSLEVLNVRSNGIDDTFPFWLNTLPELKVIVLRNNSFKGPLHRHHPFGFPKLQIIDVSNNGFNGTLPSDYFADWNMTRREDRSGVIYIRYNDYYHDSMVLMSKGVEMKLERILKLLTAIDLSGNELSGKIPESIGLLKDLIVLNLSSNGFTGDIPSSFGNQSQLESLDLSNNKLSGSIPPSLGDLSSLSYIKVSNNQLHGPIPQSTQFQTQSASSFEGNLGLCGLPLSEKCGEQSQEPEAEEAEEEEEGVLSWTAAAIALAPGVILGLTIGHILVTQKTHWFMRFLA
ncbi:hypothetical protein HID58_007397, partial [Brassica napus]